MFMCSWWSRCSSRMLNMRERRDEQNEASSEFCVLSSEFELSEKSETGESSRFKVSVPKTQNSKFRQSRA